LILEFEIEKLPKKRWLENQEMFVAKRKVYFKVYSKSPQSLPPTWDGENHGIWETYLQEKPKKQPIFSAIKWHMAKCRSHQCISLYSPIHYPIPHP